MGLGVQRFLTGLYVQQEYVCLPSLGIHTRIFLNMPSGKLWVTDSFVFVGYKPLLFAVNSLMIEKKMDRLDELALFFECNEKIIATLRIKLVEEKMCGSTRILFYEGVDGKHRFINVLQQKLNSTFLKLTKKGNSNIFLEGNLYEQVRIAYSVPRIIALITVSDGEKMNLFPTDLHGAIGDDLYVSSLRIGGKAVQQVEQTKRIVLSEISIAFFRQAYALGKNHMNEMKSIDEFSIEHVRSEIFGMPIPTGTGCYFELQLIDSFDRGVHRILLYKIVHCKKIKPIDILAHIHQYYAQWRLNQKLKDDFLIR
jgi:flavin reductase (DIM6/NTAB) family NADH-FMN oxidoreductase RutF